MITIRLGCGESITEELSLPHSAAGMEVVEGMRGYRKTGYAGSHSVIRIISDNVGTLY